MRSALATSAALVGLALTMQACSAAEDSPSAGATTTPAAAGTPAPPSASPSADGKPAADANYDKILDGEHQTLIHIVEDDKDWSATYEGPIGIGGGTDDGAKFRLVPVGADQFLIEALRAREEGGRWCVYGDASNEREPVALGTGKCEEGETTVFTITKTGEVDDKGRATHRITNEKFGTVQVKNDGSALYIQELGDGGSRGSYSFVDRGEIEKPGA